MGLENLWSLEIAAPRASGASRWLLPEPLERPDSCPQSLWSFEALEPRDGCSQSLWSLEMSAPPRWLLPEPLVEEVVEEPVEEASKLFENTRSKALSDECGDEPASQ